MGKRARSEEASVVVQEAGKAERKAKKAKKEKKSKKSKSKKVEEEVEVEVNVRKPNKSAAEEEAKKSKKKKKSKEEGKEEVKEEEQQDDAKMSAAEEEEEEEKGAADEPEAQAVEEIEECAPEPAKETKETKGDSSSVFIGNLSFKIDEETVRETFKDCGVAGAESIVAVRFGVDEQGEFKRYGHVDFDCAESARNALAIEGTRVFGKEMRVQLAEGKGAARKDAGDSFVKPDAPAENPDYVNRCCVKNLAYDIDEEVLFAAFEEQGIDAKHVTWLNDRETGEFYGTSFVTFASPEDAAWALACSEAGFTVMGRHVRVEYCPHRNDKRKAKEAAAQGGSDGKSGNGGGQGVHGKRTDQARPPSARPQNGTLTAFFGNLPYEITDENLRDFVKDAGEIVTIRWLENKDTGEFRGAGFADFADPETVDRVVKYKNGRKLLGRIVRVDYAPPSNRAKKQLGAK